MFRILIFSIKKKKEPVVLFFADFLNPTYLKETSTTVTGEYSIVFSRGMVLTYFTWNIVQDPACNMKESNISILIKSTKVLMGHQEF